MKTTFTKSIKKEMGLYDSNNELSIEADSFVDISEYCPEVEQCVIKYGKSKRGTIAQICEFYTKGVDLGATVHFFLNEETEDTLIKNSWFDIRSKVLGINPKLLAKLIYKNRK